MATDSVCRLVTDAIDLTRDDEEDDLEDVESSCALPGFDPHTNCPLCRLYTRDALVSPRGGSEVANQHGRNLDAGLLKELVRNFYEVKLTSKPHLIQGYAKKFREMGRNNPALAFLADVTVDEVWRHYFDDHDELAHQFLDPMREVERTLQNVLHQAPLTLCVELKKGRNKGRRVVHPGRLRSYLETVKTYTQLLYSKTNKQ